MEQCEAKTKRKVGWEYSDQCVSLLVGERGLERQQWLLPVLQVGVLVVFRRHWAGRNQSLHCISHEQHLFWEPALEPRIGRRIICTPAWPPHQVGMLHMRKNFGLGA